MIRDLSAFFEQVEADMANIRDNSGDIRLTDSQAHEQAMINAHRLCALGRWRYAGSTLLRICDISYNWGQKWYPDLTFEQLAEYNAEQIHWLWKSADRSFGLPDHVIVLLGTTELHHDSEAIAVHNAHHAELSRLRSAGKIKNFTIIVSVNHPVSVVDYFKAQSNTVVIPWFLYSYSSLYPQPVDGPRGSKILFTPGKIAWQNGRRMDRVATLCYLLHPHNQENWLWSYTGTKYDCVPDSELSELIQAVMQNRLPQAVRIPRENPLTVLDTLARSLDQATADLWKEQGHHRDTLAMPVSVYKQCAAEWVTETWFEMPTHLTEKIFRPMLTGTPWLTANPAHTDHLCATTDFVGYNSELTHSKPAPTVDGVPLSSIPWDIQLPAVEELREQAHKPWVKQITAHNLAAIKHTVRSTNKHIQEQHPGTDITALRRITLADTVVPPEY